ncbi:RNA-binding protein [Magnetospirillum sp. UT-4]|uniref:RNA-binding protein n=1 Tax=Magnetospirillum sp. UT-4 TaxID=2681467 RepID=UPI001381EE1D|nr:RNA-binding protein [Magnetospirillum sp. UT-4]CAA7617141.1 conserved hypothetical protein [Magnetospirillum sp. UT-4]
MAAAEEDEDSGPERRCIASGERRPKVELLRFVVSPDGTVVPDVEQRLPGRGIWLSPRRDMVNTAVTKRLFARAARQAVTVPEGLADLVEHLLVRRCLATLGLARRAGEAVCGYEKVRAELKAGRVAVLVEAAEAASGSERMKTLATGLPVVEVFGAAELGAVFGRDHAVHVGVAPGGLARRLLAEAAPLAGFRSPIAGDVG